MVASINYTFHVCVYVRSAPNQLHHGWKFWLKIIKIYNLHTNQENFKALQRLNGKQEMRIYFCSLFLFLNCLSYCTKLPEPRYKSFSKVRLNFATTCNGIQTAAVKLVTNALCLTRLARPSVRPSICLLWWYVFVFCNFWSTALGFLHWNGKCYNSYLLANQTLRVHKIQQLTSNAVVKYLHTKNFMLCFITIYNFLFLLKYMLFS